MKRWQVMTSRGLCCPVECLLLPVDRSLTGIHHAVYMTLWFKCVLHQLVMVNTDSDRGLRRSGMTPTLPTTSSNMERLSQRFQTKTKSTPTNPQWARWPCKPYLNYLPLLFVSGVKTRRRMAQDRQRCPTTDFLRLRRNIFPLLSQRKSVLVPRPDK